MSWVASQVRCARTARCTSAVSALRVFRNTVSKTTRRAGASQYVTSVRPSAGCREGYDEARRAFLIGQAVRERRLALGLSQTEVAAGAGMSQPALSRLEAGGAAPTIPVFERIAAALGAELIVTIAPHAA